MEPSMKICITCSKPNSPYKCPSCSQAYCSVACCREHKAKTPCGENAEKSNVVNRSTIDRSERDAVDMDAKGINNYPSDDTVPIEKLRKLASDDHLKSLLSGNAHFRQLLINIDRSPDPSHLLNEAMKRDEHFQRFASICLRTATDEDDPRHDEAIDERAISFLLNGGDNDTDGAEDAAAAFLVLLNDRLETGPGSSMDLDEVGSIFRK